MRTRCLGFIAAAVACLTGATSSSAATFITVDQAEFESSVSSVDAGFDPASPFQLTAVGFSSRVAGDRLEAVVRADDSAVVSFGSEVTAFGGHFNLGPGGWGSGLRFSLLRSDGTEERIDHLLTKWNGFFGLSATEAFSALRVDWSGSKYGSKETFVLSDIKVSAPSRAPAAITSPAPEPSTWALIIGGLGLAGSVLRGHRRRAVV